MGQALYANEDGDGENSRSICFPDGLHLLNAREVILKQIRDATMRLGWIFQEMGRFAGTHRWNLVCGAPADYLESTAFGAMMHEHRVKRQKEKS